MLPGVPIIYSWDLLEYLYFSRRSRFHELNKVHLKAGTGCSYRQSNGSGCFSNTLSEIQMEKAEALILNNSVSFLRVIDDALLPHGLKKLYTFR